MKNASPVNQTTIRILYGRYKTLTIPIVVMISCIILFFLILLPQVQQALDRSNEISIAEQQLSVHTQSFNIISRIDPDALNKQLQVTSQALPVDKDFAEVLNAITSAAVQAGVALGDYTFQVGDLSNSGLDKNTSLQLVLSITGGINDVEKFISALKQQFPLSDVTSIRLNNTNNASLTVVFYYSPLPKITFQNAQLLQSPSKTDQALLQKLSLIQSTEIPSSDQNVSPTPSSSQ